MGVQKLMSGTTAACMIKKCLNKAFNNFFLINLAKDNRESHCLASEPKHFPYAIVFVFIIKST